MHQSIIRVRRRFNYWALIPWIRRVTLEMKQGMVPFVAFPTRACRTFLALCLVVRRQFVQSLLFLITRKRSSGVAAWNSAHSKGACGPLHLGQDGLVTETCEETVLFLPFFSLATGRTDLERFCQDSRDTQCFKRKPVNSSREGNSFPLRLNSQSCKLRESSRVMINQTIRSPNGPWVSSRYARL